MLNGRCLKVSELESLGVIRYQPVVDAPETSSEACSRVVLVHIFLITNAFNVVGRVP